MEGARARELAAAEAQGDWQGALLDAAGEGEPLLLPLGAPQLIAVADATTAITAITAITSITSITATFTPDIPAITGIATITTITSSPVIETNSFIGVPLPSMVSSDMPLQGPPRGRVHVAHDPKVMVLGGDGVGGGGGWLVAGVGAGVGVGLSCPKKRQGSFFRF